jgi:hypothetical protein
MSELDETWELALADAARRARGAGRADVARYLDLRSQNDLLRRTAIDWLHATFTALAGEANRKGAAIQIELRDAHSFRRGSSTMIGTQVTLKRGVRAMSLESGWPRAPRDGFVRGDGLACANIKHFGRPRTNAELLLARSAKGQPQWFLIEKTGDQTLLTEAMVRDHFNAFLSES